MAYRNGGGAFLIPYLLALFMVGIPLMMLEFGLGHYFRRAFPQALEGIDRRFKWLGWWSVSFVMFGIVAYYGVVIAWCMCYVGFSVTQPWGTAEHLGISLEHVLGRTAPRELRSMPPGRDRHPTPAGRCSHQICQHAAPRLWLVAGH